MTDDLKTSAGLLVARLEMKPSARIVYIGTQDAISCAKVVLTTQVSFFPFACAGELLKFHDSSHDKLCMCTVCSLTT